MAYDVAAAICKVTGAHLVAIESQQEQLELESFTDSEAAYWLDGRAADQTKNFVWLHSHVELKKSYTKWYTGRPILTYHLDYLCLALHDFGWYDNPCTDKRNVICEY